MPNLTEVVHINILKSTLRSYFSNVSVKSKTLYWFSLISKKSV